MKRCINIIFIVWLCSNFTFGQNRIDTLSNSAQFSLLTVSPGQSMETLFGHSAIRIYDPQNGISKVYNYGTFDFEQPNFATNFLKGKLNYWLATQALDTFLYSNKLQNRGVWEQVLQLDQKSKQEVYHYLETNYLPENKNYLYDFFFDNCSTRIRDVYKNSLSGLSYEGISAQNTTYRKLLDQYLENREWTDFGMDLILGQPSDQIADFKGQMYIPDYLMQYAENMYYNDSEGKKVKLVQSTEQILIQEPFQIKSFWLTPLRVFGFFLFIEVLLIILRDRVCSRLISIYDKIWFFFLFLSSIIILLMWFATDHKVCNANLNILWVTPLPFILQFFKTRSQKRKVSIGMALYFTLFIAFWSLFPQDFSIISIIIASILVLKYIKNP